ENYPVIDVHQHIYSSYSFWSGSIFDIDMEYYDSHITHYEKLVEKIIFFHIIYFYVISNSTFSS
ncbi:MAG: hypothetical protein ACFFDF_20370, partial [Candidatus Odinarchaeota archaeon]